MRTANLMYNYYRVSVPGDMGDNIKELANHAIDMARNRAQLWCSNCTWTAQQVYGEPGDLEVIFRVCRTRPHP